mgnify:CR=1 FL=1
MLDLLLVLVLAVHLLTVNVAVAGPLFCLWLDWRSDRHGDGFAAACSHRLAAQSIVSLVLAVLLGFISLGLLWMAYPDAVVRGWSPVPARRWWFGVVEILFSLACMYAYLRWWQPLGKTALRRAARYLLPVLATTNVAYHFGFLFAMTAVMAVRPELAAEPFDFLTLLADREILARFTHMLLACPAVAGAVLMSIGRRLGDGTIGQDAGARVITWGARIALSVTCLQYVAGLYLLIALPEAARDRLMGGSVASTTVFIIALVATAALTVVLGIASLSGAGRREIGMVHGTLALVVLLMVGTRHAALAPLYAQSSETQSAAEQADADSRSSSPGEDPTP